MAVVADIAAVWCYGGSGGRRHRRRSGSKLLK